ncbi:6108_t:CDS:1 [Funneliformis caledonium]|uniref:6108_t:CDS:1 n=1 Tax=Funneliformis caledonium TaxID=1117310 RepID=A0A9N9HT39_9GLOM|nr:6108_t:CDS:1 [Funneliformis caledonium]
MKLLKIVQNHSHFDKLSLFVNENQHLLECLPYIALKKTVGSLTANEDFDLMKYSEFLTMSKNVKEKAGTGSEPFSGALLKLMKSVKLSSEILTLLVEYYNNAYSNSFVFLSDIHNLLPGTIAVFSQINQFGRLRLRAEVYRLTYAKRHIRSVNVLSKFVLDDNMTNTYPGQIQFFF